MARESTIDFISEPKWLIDAIPKFEDLFEGIQDLRAMQEEATKISNATRAVGMTNGGTLMRLACFPKSLYAAIVQVNPNFLKDKPEFYRWLDRHPEYRVGRTVAY